MPDNLLDNLDVFYGELTPARATVYARLERLENNEGLSLSGFVRGPRCFYSNTLQSTCRLEDAGPGPSLLAKSLVTDPCYWSPETPNIYDVTVELRRGGELVASDVRQIGFKPLGVSGRYFTWEGRPWVLRGISTSSSTNKNVVAWRDYSAVVMYHDVLPPHELQDASERGVMLMISSTGEEEVDMLKYLARFPAVAFFHIPWDVRDISLRHAAPNIHLVGDAQPFPVIIAHWTQAHSRKESSIPVIMDRPLPQPLGLADARAACDKLQADLAPIGQFAGYIV